MSREDIPFFHAFISGILTFLNLLLNLVFLATSIVRVSGISVCLRFYKLPLWGYTRSVIRVHTFDEWSNVCI